MEALLAAAKTSWTQMKSSSNPQDVFQRREEAVKKRNISSSLRSACVFVSTCERTLTHICSHRGTHRLQTWPLRHTSCHQSAAVGPAASTLTPACGRRLSVARDALSRSRPEVAKVSTLCEKGTNSCVKKKQNTLVKVLIQLLWSTQSKKVQLLKLH